VAGKIVPEALPVLRDAIRDALDQEDERGESFNARASALIGFVGVILSVAAAASLAGGVTNDPQRDWVKALVAVLLIGGGATLLFSVGAAVFKILRPLPGKRISTRDTDAFNEAKFTHLQPGSVDRYLIDAYGKALTAERVRNDGKAAWLIYSYVALLVGVGLVALAGFASTLDRYVGGASERPARAHDSGHRDRHGDGPRRSRRRP
jgi:hypothetical protein